MAGTPRGSASPYFTPIRLQGGIPLRTLARQGVSGEMGARLQGAPQGECVFRGISFDAGRILALRDRPVQVPLDGRKARWLVFLHTSDTRPLEGGPGGIISPMRGEGQLGELACTYRVMFADGADAAVPIRRRFQVGAFTKIWGENCFEAVSHLAPHAVRPHHEQPRPSWGSSQTRVDPGDGGDFLAWMYAWENPRPDAAMDSLRCEPSTGTVVLFGVAAGTVDAHPLRWETRRKALLTVPEGVEFSYRLDDSGLLDMVKLDLGQVISALPQPVYPDAEWENGFNNQLPGASKHRVLLEYTAHPQAQFHFESGALLSVERLSERPLEGLQVVPRSMRRIQLRVMEKGGSAPVPVKLHVHGSAGEYIAPVDRHRIPNPAWYEDYSVDFVHRADSTSSAAHWCTYISGETTIDVPLGAVYIEVSRGFEISPVRKRIVVSPSTERIEIELERVLPWREKGWISADTHVHFLSPATALLEGRAEGVNVVNLLASQWGELMTNVGDFDGTTTWGSRESGGDGEYLVRVGTENRQHVLGHISLLGYGGSIIAPMTTGGPDESALGDGVESLLTEWAEACRSRGGIVVVPHFPQPRAEHAAAIVAGKIDGVEMTSWGDLYSGINPYSLSDWYRYLNCGHLVAAVGGTDKMSADTAVGTVRTYARIPDGLPFTYEEWKKAVRRCETFVTYGPLLEFTVDGHPMGSRIRAGSSGGTFDVSWTAASATIPMSRVELVVNGETRESVAVEPGGARGSFSMKLDRSSWAALLVRGKYPDRPEVVAAHSSPVMIEAGDSPLFAAADALTILEQIEGALAYLDTAGTRAETAAYKRMRLVLESAHRSLHNRMHKAGHFHEHSPVRDHEGHHHE
jgi:hypothetical protein